MAGMYFNQLLDTWPDFRAKTCGRFQSFMNNRLVVSAEIREVQPNEGAGKPILDIDSLHAGRSSYSPEQQLLGLR